MTLPLDPNQVVHGHTSHRRPERIVCRRPPFRHRAGDAYPAFDHWARCTPIFPKSAQVRFLVDGQQRDTLAGHADLTRVYLAYGFTGSRNTCEDWGISILVSGV